MNLHALLAVFRRNFVSYFASPTGYVFICVFVLLTTIAAFWPNDFFNSNLANLDQLNWGIQIFGYRFGFPLIMLIFVPAITMGIWADERRQGTDELLLTIPATDFDIVLGKYLAAVAIFSAALLYSMFCNAFVLVRLGSPDLSLYVCTYFGYWLVGLAMLAVGMVASFLTSDLTVAFILGATFNAPLVVPIWTAVAGMPAALWAVVRAAAGRLGMGSATYGTAMLEAMRTGERWSQAIQQVLIPEQFSDFGRGVATLSGVAYFLLIVGIMLYVSMVLIGRRHWRTGSQQWSMGVHFAARAASMAVIAAGLTVHLGRYDLRLDMTAEKINSVAPETYTLLRGLDPKHPVQIEAFVSPNVPEAYVQTRLNLLSMLREIKAAGGGNVRVEVHDTEPFSEEAARAERRYGIEPREVFTLDRGVMNRSEIVLGVAMNCGLQRVTIPFLDRGIPVEYELVRSIATVTDQERKTLGVVMTDAQLFGRFDMQRMSSTPDWPIIRELEKQYDVERVDPTQPISDDYDVLLAVQPSSLGPEEMEHFIAAIEGGIPTAIFEDPLPVFANVPATSRPRQPPGGMNPMMMFGGMQSPPKGDIGRLWRLLGVDFTAQEIVWQDYNPYKKARHFPEEFVFVDVEAGGKEPFAADHPISAGLQQVLFPFPGSVKRLHVSEMRFTPLVRAGGLTGTVAFDEVMRMGPFGPGGLNPDRRQVRTEEAYILAAHIRGKVKPTAMMADEPADDDADPEFEAASEEPKPRKHRQGEINVVVVADIDMLTEDFFRLREQGSMPESGVHFDFDNVTFVLNVLDQLADDDRFLALRKRRPAYRTLTRIEQETKDARDAVAKAREERQEDLRREMEDIERARDKRLEEMRARKNIDPQQLIIELAMAEQDWQRRIETRRQQLQQELNRERKRIDTDLNLEIRRVQDRYKLWAVLLPPILPLALGISVFFIRRLGEREGVSRSRLR
jgi:ABC-2 type transport system permease protein